MIEIEKTEYLYLLLLLPVAAGLFLYSFYWQRKKRAQFGDTALFKRLVQGLSTGRIIIRSVIALLAIAAVVLALANPIKGSREETLEQKGIDIVFAIDVSKSMLAEDVNPNRLDKSKQIVSEVIKHLGTDRIGIVGYAGSAYPVLPITSDFGIGRMYLQSMNTNMVSSQGTAIGEAIKLATSYFDNPKAGKVLVLLSDGEDHGEDAEDAAEEAQEAGISIITVGIGTTEGGTIPLKEDGVTRQLKRDKNGEVVVTKLFPDQLKAIAETANGKYIEAVTPRQNATAIMKSIATIEKTAYKTRRVADFNSHYQLPALIAFILLVLDLFILDAVKPFGQFNFLKRRHA